jgi:hypothetical protein
MKNKLVNYGMLALTFLLMINPVMAARCTAFGKEIPCDVFWAIYGWIFAIFMVIFVLIFGFWIWMLVDCIKREKFNDKTLWILIILLANWIGAFVYYFVVKRKG